MSPSKFKFLKLPSVGSDSLFLKNLSWLGLSEIFVRLTRLLTAVVLARYLDPIAFGVAALVLTINELIRVFNNNGIGAKIIQCEDDEVDDIANTAYRLNFVFCGSLFVLQCLLSFPLADYYEVPELIPMLVVLSFTYLLMPFGMVQASLLRRSQKFKRVALIDGGQVGVDNLITALLAVLGFGPWAIVLPKFLTSPIWVFGYRYAYRWSPSGSFTDFGLWKSVLKFGRSYLGIEVLKTARLNLDNMIIGRILGLEALGLYYFARNAGLGFSLTLINSISSALFPNLCEIKDDLELLKSRFKRILKQISLVAFPLIGMQALLAPIYVPIVFGEQWTQAIPVLMFLCLSALPRPFAEAASALAIAVGKIKIDLRWNIIFTLIFVLSVIMASAWGLNTIAMTIMVIYLVSHPIYLIYVWREVFSRDADQYKAIADKT